jgi:hypothetical protein
MNETQNFFNKIRKEERGKNIRKKIKHQDFDFPNVPFLFPYFFFLWVNCRTSGN